VTSSDRFAGLPGLFESSCATLLRIDYPKAGFTKPLLAPMKKPAAWQGWLYGYISLGQPETTMSILKLTVWKAGEGVVFVCPDCKVPGTQACGASDKPD
jgi:hypothetical protein